MMFHGRAKKVGNKSGLGFLSTKALEEQRDFENSLEALNLNSSLILGFELARCELQSCPVLVP
jgi:hypothetical protein